MKDFGVTLNKIIEVKVPKEVIDQLKDTKETINHIVNQVAVDYAFGEEEETADEALYYLDRLINILKEN